MKLTRTERAARREAFRRMNAAEKAEYIFSYYKLPLALALIALYILCYGTYRVASRKEVLLYVGFLNVAVGEDAQNALTGGFVAFSEKDARKHQVYAYQNLYLSDNAAPANHEYAYASRLKLLAAIDAEQLDVVLMNREAYDLLSGKGWLLELPPFLSHENSSLFQRLRSCLTENRVVLSDNQLDLALGKEARYQAESVSQANALDVSRFPVFREAAFTGPVFLGVLPNSPRMSAVLEYIAYLESGC